MPPKRRVLDNERLAVQKTAEAKSVVEGEGKTREDEKGQKRRRLIKDLVLASAELVE